jgi:hypothetical protein
MNCVCANFLLHYECVYVCQQIAFGAMGMYMCTCVYGAL